MEAVPVENFRTSDGYFPTTLTCSGCSCATEVFIELIQGGPIVRLCKGCLEEYVGLINKCYQSKMSK